MSQIKTGVILIDQQKAHERILYEKYLDALDRQTMASQQKLFPKTVTLNSSDEILLKYILPEIRLLGFDINELGKNTFVVNGVPAELNHHDEQGLVEYILENYKQQTSQSDKKEKIARTLAKRASVKVGTKLSEEEMNVLMDELFACKIFDYSPDGNVCVVKLSVEDIFGLFEKS